MTSGDQCFGSRVTLLCAHPDPFAESERYIQEGIRWAENGTTIDVTDPSSSTRFTPTRLNSTASTLSFIVTKEVITCTCFLVLNNANRDRKESNVVTIDTLGEYVNLLLFQKLYIINFVHLLMYGPFILLELYYSLIFYYVHRTSFYLFYI